MSTPTEYRLLRERHDRLRERLLLWIDDQRQALPEWRTPAAHGKAELLRDLRALLDQEDA